jgi:hypothetical protein
MVLFFHELVLKSLREQENGPELGDEVYPRDAFYGEN